METWVDGREEQGELQYSFPHALERLEGWVKSGNSPITLRGVRGEVRLLLLLALQNRLESPMVVVVPKERDAQTVYEQLVVGNANSDNSSMLLPFSTVSPYQTLPSNRLIEAARVRGVWRMGEDDCPKIIVLAAPTLDLLSATRDSAQTRTLSIRVGDV